MLGCNGCWTIQKRRQRICSRATFNAQQDYRVVNLWEVDASTVLAKPLQPLVPYTPAMRGGAEEGILRQAVLLLRSDQTLAELEPLLAFFASFVLDTKLIKSIMRWDMAVLRESPWYYEIHKEGYEEGVEQGIEQGIEQGSHETALRNLTNLLRHRFGPLPATIPSTLAALQAARLQALFDVALEVETLAEFQANLLSNGVVASNG
jgi:predicted transposase YdaD